jgi:hypothetical protein
VAGEVERLRVLRVTRCLQGFIPQRHGAVNVKRPVMAFRRHGSLNPLHNYSTAVITNSLLTSEQGVLFLTRCITPGPAQ